MFVLEFLKQGQIPGSLDQHPCEVSERIPLLPERRVGDRRSGPDVHPHDPSSLAPHTLNRRAGLREQALRIPEETPVQRRTPGQPDPEDGEPVSGSLRRRKRRPADRLRNVGPGLGAADGNLYRFPPYHVEFAPRYLSVPVADGDQRSALGACLPDVAALDVPREDDPGSLVEGLPPVDVAERPVVVSLGGEVHQLAGCVVVVPVHAAESGMKGRRC